MAIEYAGYIPTTKQVNWESLTDKFAEKVGTAISARKEERASLDKIAADNEKMINEQQLGKSQTVNEFITREGFKGKNFINGLNKELKLGHITPQQYKLAMNNVTENWGLLSSSAKTYDERRAALFERQQANLETGKIDGASFELELQQLNEEALDMANNSTQWSQNGNLSLAKTDKDGKIIGELNDIRSLNIPENILVNRVHVSDEVTDAVKGFGDFSRYTDLGGGADKTVKGVFFSDDFKLARQNIVNKIFPDSDSRRQISVITDNGGFIAEYYQDDADKEARVSALVSQLAKDKVDAGLDKVTDAEKNQIRTDLEKENSKKKASKRLTADQITKKVIERTDLLTEKKANLVNVTDADREAIELTMVKLVKGPNGVINPELTMQQKNYGKKLVENIVNLSVENQITGTAKATYAPSSGGSTAGGNKEKVDNASVYKAITGAIARNDVGTLNAYSILKRRYEILPNGYINVYMRKGSWYQGDLLKEDMLVAENVKEVKAFANDFIKGDDPLGDWDKQELLYNKSNVPVTGKQTPIGADKSGKVIYRTSK